MVPKVSSKLVSHLAWITFVIVFRFFRFRFCFRFHFFFFSFCFWVGLTFIICYITIIQILLCQHKNIVVKYFDLVFGFHFRLILLTVSRTGLLYLLIRQLYFVTDFVICVSVSVSVFVCVWACDLFFRFLNFYKVIILFDFCFG